MQSAIIVSQQVLVMFLMIGCGLFFNRRRLISESAAREFCSLLLNLALPCVIIQSFLRPMRPEYLSGFAMAIGIAFAMHLFAVAAAQLLIRPRADEGYRVERFSAVYSNCAFMAFPLLRATVGEDGVFYATAFVSCSSGCTASSCWAVPSTPASCCITPASFRWRLDC